MFIIIVNQKWRAQLSDRDLLLVFEKRINEIFNKKILNFEWEFERMSERDENRKENYWKLKILKERDKGIGLDKIDLNFVVERKLIKKIFEKYIKFQLFYGIEQDRILISWDSTPSYHNTIPSLYLVSLDLSLSTVPMHSLVSIERKKLKRKIEKISSMKERKLNVSSAVFNKYLARGQWGCTELS